MLLSIIYIVIGLAGLFVGGEWLVKGASRLAASFGVAPLVIGLTIVAFGTSTPELLVSLQAALGGSSDISLGNVVGSNIANIGLILGVSGMLIALPVHITLIRREIPVMIAASVVTFLLALDGQIAGVDGIILFAGIILFTGTLLVLSRRERTTAEEDAGMADVEGIGQPINRALEFGRLALGLAILLVGSNFTINGAVDIARVLGVSELVIGITLVAVGTSLPEMAASVIAALRRQPDIAVGNIVGSNIFNLFGILGLTALVRPIGVAEDLLRFDFLVMIGFAVLLLPLSLNRVLTRREALLFLAGYAGFVILTFTT